MIDHNTVALVTGANRGLGAAFVSALLAQGAKKVYVASRSGEAALADQDNRRIVPITLDVTDPKQVEAAGRLASDVNLLINNAGQNRQSTFLSNTQPDDARAEMEVNYFGTLAMARAFAPQLRTSCGAMINVLSILARVSLPMMGSLCASKAAALRLNESLAAALQPQGVRVFAVLPGAIDTDMSRDYPGDKLSPADVAEQALAALESSDIEVYIGAMAKELATGLASARTAVQQQVLGLTLA